MAVATVTSVNVKQAVPFFGVTNMESSLHFYLEGLGFKMKHGGFRIVLRIIPTVESAGAGLSLAPRPSCFRSSGRKVGRKRRWGPE